MREEELFYLALEQPPDRRATFLDGACAGDPELRRRVEVLLRAHDEPGSFLAGPPAGVEPTADLRRPRPDNAGPGIPVGGAAVAPPVDRVGPYKLLQVIGEGGMGTVYMAEQTAPVNRVVAVKLVRPGMDSRAVLARFEAERQALALMDHPNIAKVLDAGEAEGRPFFAMELVKGVPITKFCDERQLTPKERLGLFVPVCQAIQHAHQKGVIHRDIKPSNVLVALYDGRPVPKVIDFGIAKATGQKLTDKTLFTGFGAVVGTLEYMSPEQAELNQLDVDTRSDIYSLGVLLYELLTGTTPLDRKRLAAAALLEVLRQIREEEPPAPSARLSTTAELPAIAASRGTDPGRLARLVRGELDWIVMKALEKDRARRYDTATGLAQDVGRYLRDEPVSACPPSAAYRAWKFLRRNRGPVLASGLLAAALVAGAAVSVYYAIQSADRARASAAAEFRADGEAENAKANAARAIAQRDRARGLLYVARMQPLPRLWSEGKRGRVLEVLAEQLPGPDEPDLRSWEWHHQWRLCHGAVRTFDGHRSARPGVTEPVEALAFSPDGRWLVSTGGSIIGTKVGDGEVILWDLAAAKEARRLAAHTARVASAAFSPDGRILATGAWDNTVRLWDAATGRLIHTCHHELDEGLLVAFSPDGRRLVSLSNTRVGVGALAPAPPPDASHATVKVWDADRGRELHGWKTGVTELVAFLSDGRLLTVAAGGAAVRDPATGREVRQFPRETGGEHAAVSADGTRLAVASPTGMAIYDLPRGRVVCQITKLPAVETNALALNPDGRLLAAAGSDGAVRVWHLREGPPPAPVVFRVHDGSAARVAFSADGRLIATTGSDGLVRVWDVETPAPEMRRLTVRRGPDRAVFTPDGTRLIGFGGGATAPTVWDAVGGRKLPGPPDGRAAVTCAAVSPDGRTVASGGLEGAVRLWNSQTWEQAGAFTADGPVWALAFSADGRQLAAGCGDGEHKSGEVRVWDLPGGREAHRLRGHPRPVAAVAFGPDGAVLAVGNDGTIKVWDAAGRELRGGKIKMGERGGVVRAMAFSPDRQLVACAGDDSRVRLWDVAERGEVRALAGHAGGFVYCAAFSPDGRRLASADEKEIKLWDVGSGQELYSVPLPVSALTNQPELAAGLLFSPDGGKLVGTGFSLRVWDARPLTPELEVEREALALLDWLFARPLPHEAVLAEVRAAPALAEPVRRRALELADRFRAEDDPRRYAAAARHAAVRAHLPAEWHRRALVQAEAACALAPDDGPCLTALGMARYRLGRYEDALQALTRAEPLNAVRPPGGPQGAPAHAHPSDLALLALTHHRLGRAEDAKRYLTRAREAVKNIRWTNDDEAAAMLREAAAVIDTKNTP